MMTNVTELKPRNTPRQVLFASMVGTTVEFFDFYIYATAAVLVFPKLFFPSSDPTSSTLASLATTRGIGCGINKTAAPPRLPLRLGSSGLRPTAA